MSARIQAKEPPRREELSERSWYLIQCRPRQEERAIENLGRQGFECYRPVYAQERVRQCHRAVTVAALFPGYLFIRLDRICDDWAPIRSTRGVAHIVRFGDFPLPIADKIIEKIQARLLKGPLHEPYLKFGQRVRIAEGTFSGIEAIFLTNDGEERVVLLLSILQSEQKLSFPITNVRKVD